MFSVDEFFKECIVSEDKHRILFIIYGTELETAIKIRKLELEESQFSRCSLSPHVFPSSIIIIINMSSRFI